ncbi:hypothetical protein VKT23_003630 [Stygiomarasmius scandens]|uniref:Uncharacterized protein n=1 Tax=Marasmiellus scandens TaxID=2682957 RepID=A0ABR1JYI7_9AGAR
MNLWLRPIRRQPLLEFRHVRQLRHYSEEASVDLHIRNRHRLVSTFNPARLKRTDYLDVSGLKRLTLQLEDTRAIVDYICIREGGTKRLPFPPNTTGFFYYYTSPHSPLDGGIRFRLTSLTAKPSPISLFLDGQDLLSPRGLPWSIPLCTLTRQKQHAELVSRLVMTRMVDRGTVDKCKQLFAGYSPMRWNSNVLFSLDQVIAVKRDAKSCSIFVVLDDRIEVATVSASRILGEYQREGDGHPGKFRVMLMLPFITISTPISFTLGLFAYNGILEGSLSLSMLHQFRCGLGQEERRNLFGIF